MSTIKNREDWAKAAAKELPTICKDHRLLMNIPDGWSDIFMRL